MKQLVIPFMLLFMITACEKSQVSYKEVAAAFKKANDSIELLSYRVRRIDTFAGGGVWDNSGFAHLERNRKDTIFGFNFYGKRDDVAQISIYDQGKNFDLDMEEKLYEVSPGGYYFTGSPGGQVISNAFFELETTQDSSWVEATDYGFKIYYTYPNDSLYLIMDRKKIVDLDKNYRPLSVRVSSLNQGERTSTTITFSDVKINQEVDSDLDSYKTIIRDYTILEPEVYEASPYIGEALPELILTDIQTGSSAQLETDKLLLIDFWEVWCGPCIKSFPEVENLYQNHKNDLLVIGVATENKDKAVDLIEAKGVTFDNYFQDQAFLDQFNIKGWPTYLLVDQSGIIVKEYFGFNAQIEKDILELINE